MENPLTGFGKGKGLGSYLQKPWERIYQTYALSLSGDTKTASSDLNMAILQFIYYHYFYLSQRIGNRDPHDNARMILSTLFLFLTIPVCVEIIDFFFSTLMILGMFMFVGWVLMVYYTVKWIVDKDGFKLAAQKRFSTTGRMSKAIGSLIVLLLLFCSIVFGIYVGVAKYVIN